MIHIDNLIKIFSLNYKLSQIVINLEKEYINIKYLIL